jgi:hypothetical protein
MAGLVAIEAYHITSCEQLPNQYGTYFDSMAVSSPEGGSFSPKWFTHEYGHPCNVSTTIHNSSYVAMQWDPQAHMA